MTDDNTLNRRTILKSLGTTGIAAVGSVAMTGTAAAENYETITVGANETKKYTVGENRPDHTYVGDTLQNKLFDISADEAYVKVRATGSNWTIRDIGFRGKFNCRDRARGSMLSVETDSGGTGLIENVYFGDGSTTGHGTPIFVGINHAGRITIRKGYFRHWAGHAVYGSAPGRSAPSDGGGGGGDVQIEQCYGRNNNIDNFRIGTDGSYVRDTVVHVDGDVAGAYNNPDTENARGIWVKEGGDCTIDNCDILLEHPDSGYCIFEHDPEEAGRAYVTNSEVKAGDGSKGLYHGNVDTNNVGHSPDISVPAGIPQSAKEAANGEDGGGSSPDLRSPKNDISFSGGSSNNVFNYYFWSGGSVEAKSGIGGNDSVGDNDANGQTIGGTDTYLFEQDVRGMTLDLGNYMSVHLDYSSRTIEFEGADDGNAYRYYLEVTGDLRPTGSSDGHTVQVDPNGDSVNGAVGSGSDRWEYTGELAHIGLDGGTATVDVLRRHLLKIEDYSDGTRADYNFTVSGSVKKGKKADSGDSVSGNSISGAVAGGGTDNYVYTGRLTDFNHSGAIHTYLDKKEVITPSLGHNTVSLEGPGTKTKYLFKVIGGLGKSAVGDSSINDRDDITNRTADGAVRGGDDSYDYRDAVRAGATWNGITHYFHTS